MDPNGQGDLSKGATSVEENMEEKQRSALGIATQRQIDTEQSENVPRTPVSAAPKSPTSPVSPDSPTSSGSAEPTDLRKLDSEIVQVRELLEGDAALAHLPENERLILKRQLDVPDVKVTYISLYRYATTWDKLFIAIAAIAAIGAGAVMPLMTVIFGNLSGSFQGLVLGDLEEAFDSILNRYVLYFVYLAVGEFVLIYTSTVLFIYTGEHITSKVREQYLRAILSQNIGYFDKIGAGAVTTMITANTNLMQEAISEKVGLTLTGVAAFFAAFVIGFVKFWKLTLICMSSVVTIVVLMGAGGRKMAGWNKKSLAAYALGGSVAEEVLASIRNAVAFGTQDKLAKQYDVHLQEARHWGIRSKSALGCMIGSLLCIIFLNYGLAFWMGSRFLVSGETTLAHILTIVLAVMIGAFSFGNVGPNIQHFAAGVAAASKIYATIDRASPLDPLSGQGKTLENVEGAVELRNIKHIYPSRAEVVVMEDVNLFIPAGKTTALVGASGSGKSTIVGLVERFYDPVGGAVYLDGHDISTLNLHWLRQQIALVQQEPVLFSQTIKENIKNGLIGSKYEQESEEQQMDRIIGAAKKANAHDFISSLPDGYETHVGERGFLLSGGQKQRVAIARAVVSDPKILLLDEATSALDTKSEGVVQQALDEAAKGRTTIVIAHRLSTIKTADNIVVMQNGRIVEQGSHDQLLELKGSYFNLVSAQRIGGNDEDESEKDTEGSDEAMVRIQSKKSASLPGVDPDDEKLALGRSKSQKSVSSKILAEKSQDGQAKYSLWTLIQFIARFNRTEWKLMIVGFFFSAIAGSAQPVQGIFFAKSIVALAQPLFLRDQIRSDINFWALMYLMLAFVDLIAMVVQGIAFAYCSESLVQRARDGAFRRFLRQDISFFDEEENSTGALTSYLSTETTHLSAISGATLGTLISCSSTLIVAVVIALAIGWKLALVCCCALPVILGTGFFRFYILAKFTATAQKHYEKSAGYACEHTNAIRTVASLTTEQEIYGEYRRQLRDQLGTSLKANLRNSSLYAASQSAMYLAFALGFWYGGQLMASGEYSLFQFFLVFAEIIFGAQSAGTVFSFAGDMSKARNAAGSLKKLYDRQPTIDPWSLDGESIDDVEGSIEFRDVHFRYPTRPDVPVLRGLNLTVKPGQYIALVGASGCGKSTTIAMMERFYDPLAGGVYIDGKEISRLNLNDYRSHLALVSQEPTLYQGTIKENVLLGVDRGEVSDERVIRACKDANIYDFIMSLP
jgi:ATP-binding cassette subfamily B (MDR/TAP) protein 1